MIPNDKDVDPGEMDVVLADYIGLYVVEQLTGDSNSTRRLQFELSKRRVSVKSNSRIHVDGQIR